MIFEEILQSHNVISNLCWSFEERLLMLLQVCDYKLLSQHIQMVITLEHIVKVWIQTLTDKEFKSQEKG